MTVAFAYSPPRDFTAKLRRAMTQNTPARPARLKFDAPVLSVCFDDFPHSAALYGAAALEARGARGTFYASASLSGRHTPSGLGFTAEDLRKLRAAGHEIGCHSFSHHDCARLDPFIALKDIARNRDAMAELGLDAPMRSLAFPYGETNSELKAMLPPRFETARGVARGLNAGKVDLAQLRAFPLYGEGGLERAHLALAQAAKRKAWMIAFTHDVSDAPSDFGTSVAALEDFLDAAIASGFQIKTMADALSAAEVKKL